MANADTTSPCLGVGACAPLWQSSLGVAPGLWRAITGFIGSKLVFTLDFQRGSAKLCGYSQFAGIFPLLAVSPCSPGLMAPSPGLASSQSHPLYTKGSAEKPRPPQSWGLPAQVWVLDPSPGGPPTQRWFLCFWCLNIPFYIFEVSYVFSLDF